MRTDSMRASMPPTPDEAEAANQRLLLVDDDPTILRSLGRDLRSRGWEVDTATSSERGLSMTHQVPYCVILTDLHMPSSSGLDLIRAVHEESPHTSFVLITGDTEVTLPPEAPFQSKIASVTFKPWDATALNTTLCEASKAYQQRVKGSLLPLEVASLGRVLLVEDNTTDALLAESCLSRVGNYGVVRVARLSDAIGQLHEDKFDFVLTDLALPDARGLDAVSRLIETAPSAAVIVLSGMADERLSLEAIERGAQDFLLKDRLDPHRLGSCLRFARERKLSQLRLEQLAHEDPLTGLFNRRMFHVRMEHLIARARRAKQQFAVFFVDLDHFKPINDEFGHDVGDELLKEVATRILGVVREYDTAARMGGDEFAILVENLQGTEEAGAVAQRLVWSLADPYALSGAMLRVTPSVGVAVFPDVADNQEELLNCADAAMYEVKRATRNGYRIYQGHRTLRPEGAGAKDFHAALAKGEFRLHYEPQWGVQSREIVGFEAFLRWCRKDGIVEPEDFVRELEHSNAMEAVGQWVIDSACERLALWAQRDPELRMSVNVSARQFESASMLEVVRKSLRKFHLKPSQLEIDITEGVLIRDSKESHQTMEELKQLGVTIAVDSFGTGYSSLAFLSRVPVDVLKIDRSFVAQLNTCANSATLASTIVAMGHRLGLVVVAEGVETEAQMDFLRAEGCDLAQGCWLSTLAENEPSLSSPPISGRFPFQAESPQENSATDEHMQPGAEKVGTDSH